MDKNLKIEALDVTVNSLNGSSDTTDKYLHTDNDGELEWVGISKELFWCTYGTTTYAEITAALEAGKFPVCKYNNQIYTYGRKDDNKYSFTYIWNTISYYLTVTDENVWSNTDTGTLQTTSNKVTSITASATDTQYPSAKAVYTELSNKQNSLPVAVKGNFLHTNASTGALEWASAGEAYSAGDGISLSGTEFSVNNTVERTSNKSTSITASSTDAQYPSAKAVYEYHDTTKQDKLPETVKDRYLHTNLSTGALEWTEVESKGKTVNLKYADLATTTFTETEMQAVTEIEVTEIPVENTDYKLTSRLIKNYAGYDFVTGDKILTFASTETYSVFTAHTNTVVMLKWKYVAGEVNAWTYCDFTSRDTINNSIWQYNPNALTVSQNYDNAIELSINDGDSPHGLGTVTFNTVGGKEILSATPTNIDVSKVSVSNTGSATQEVSYITIDDTEYKLAGGGSGFSIEQVPVTAGFGNVICLANYGSEPVGTVHYLQPAGTLSSSTQLQIQYGSNTTPSTSTTRTFVYVTPNSQWVKIEKIGSGIYLATTAEGKVAQFSVGGTSYNGWGTLMGAVAKCNYGYGKSIYAPEAQGSPTKVLVGASSVAASPTWKDIKTINNESILGTGNINASDVSVSTEGTSTSEVSYITINGTEYKLVGGGGSSGSLPEVPEADGVYTLQATRANGVVTYEWVTGVEATTEE